MVAYKSETRYVRFGDGKLKVEPNPAGGDVRTVTFNGAFVGEVERVYQTPGRDLYRVAGAFGRSGEHESLNRAVKLLGIRALCPPPVVQAADEIAF